MRLRRVDSCSKRLFLPSLTCDGSTIKNKQIIFYKLKIFKKMLEGNQVSLNFSKKNRIFEKVSDDSGYVWLLSC